MNSAAPLASIQERPSAMVSARRSIAAVRPVGLPGPIVPFCLSRITSADPPNTLLGDPRRLPSDPPGHELPEDSEGTVFLLIQLVRIYTPPVDPVAVAPPL